MRVPGGFRQNVFDDAASYPAGALILFQNYFYFRPRFDVLQLLPIHS